MSTLIINPESSKTMKKTCCGSVIRNKTSLKVVEPKGRKCSESLSCGFNHEILPLGCFLVVLLP